MYFQFKQTRIYVNKNSFWKLTHLERSHLHFFFHTFKQIRMWPVFLISGQSYKINNFIGNIAVS